MNYTLDITASFEDEVADILNYIEYKLGSGKAADSLEIKIYDTISSIACNPLLYPIYRNNKISAEGYRFVTVKNYILFYTVDENKKIIHISRFIYGRRNMDNMF